MTEEFKWESKEGLFIIGIIIGFVVGIVAGYAAANVGKDTECNQLTDAQLIHNAEYLAFNSTSGEVPFIKSDQLTIGQMKFLYKNYDFLAKQALARVMRKACYEELQ